MSEGNLSVAGGPHARGVGSALSQAFKSKRNTRVLLKVSDVTDNTAHNDDS